MHKVFTFGGAIAVLGIAGSLALVTFAFCAYAESAERARCIVQGCEALAGMLCLVVAWALVVRKRLHARSQLRAPAPVRITAPGRSPATA